MSRTLSRYMRTVFVISLVSIGLVSYAFFNSQEFDTSLVRKTDDIHHVDDRGSSERRDESRDNDIYHYDDDDDDEQVTEEFVTTSQIPETPSDDIGRISNYDDDTEANIPAQDSDAAKVVNSSEILDTGRIKSHDNSEAEVPDAKNSNADSLLNSSAILSKFKEASKYSNMSKDELLSQLKSFVAKKNEKKTPMFAGDWPSECITEGLHTKLMSGEEFSFLQSCDRVLYNRVPKCGSRTTLSAMHKLASNLNFSMLDVPKFGRHNYFDWTKDKTSFVKNFTEFKPPFIYAQHVHIVNFTSYNLPMPLHINVIRDPVDRMVSEYYYNQYGSSGTHWKERASENAMTFDECVRYRKGPCMAVHRILPFFCGHDKNCMARNDWTLARAKQIADRYYMVIGIQEELTDFMRVLEALLPQFFTNAVSEFQNIESQAKEKYKTTVKREISQQTREIMAKHLHHEYDFYYFVKKRFRDLYNTVVKP